VARRFGGKRGCKRGRVGPRFTSLTALTLFCFGGLLLLGGAVTAQTVSPSPDATPTASVTGNPAATTFATGTGQLGRWLGLRDEWGLRLGGLWLADINGLVAGGAQPGSWTVNSALFVNLAVDAVWYSVVFVVVAFIALGRLDWTLLVVIPLITIAVYLYL